MNIMFFQKPIALSVDKHKEWKIEAVEDYKFAKKTNSVYLMSAEFVLASKEYPIVFIRNNDIFTPIALLGVEQDNNSFVTPKGDWDADYIPAYVRRYPFIPATKEGSDELMLCIDSEYKGLNSKKAKLPLFEKDSKPGVITQQAIELSQSYIVENNKTKEFCKVIDALELFDEVSIGKADDKGGEFKLTGVFRINSKRFSGLDYKAVKSLFDSGALELVYAHFQSLANLKNIS